MHARPFCGFPADFDGPAVVLLLDLETTGVDVASDQIIEFAVFDIRGAAFSTVVKASTPDTAFMTEGSKPSR